METVKQGKSQSIVRNVAKFVAIFLFLLFCGFAEFFGVRGFSVAAFVALMLLKQKHFVLAPVFVAASVLSSPTLFTALGSVAATAVMVTHFFINKKLEARDENDITEGKITNKRTVIISLKCIFSVIAVAVYLGIRLFDNLNLPPLLIPLSLFVSIVFCVCVLHASSIILREKLRFRLLPTQFFCLCTMLVVFGLGLARLEVFSFPLYLALAFALVLFVSYVMGLSPSLIVAFSLGLGRGLIHFEVMTLSVLVLTAFIASVFSNNHKIFSALAGVVLSILFLFYFNTALPEFTMQAIAIASGAILFVILPSKGLKSLKNNFFSSHEKEGARHMINKFRSDAAINILNYANIFSHLAYLSNNEVSSIEKKLKEVNFVNMCCAHCESFEKCSSNKNFFTELDRMLKSTHKKDGLQIKDLASPIIDNCTNLSKVVSASRDIANIVKEVKLKNEATEMARVLMTKQLNGVDVLLKNLAQDNLKTQFFDGDREKILKQELNFKGVYCTCTIIASDAVVLIIRRDTLDEKAIEKSVSFALKSYHKIFEISDTTIAHFCAVTLKPAPPYDVVFSTLSVPKFKSEELKVKIEEKDNLTSTSTSNSTLQTPHLHNGDTHSFLKLDNHRMLIALCDGMGSGKKAQEVSSSVLNLVENFYKAGFSHEIVFSSVGRMLNLTSEEVICCLDISIVDLKEATIEIIKMASPPSYIKTKEGIKKITGSSLPLGVNQLEPVVTKIPLDIGDTLVLTSDGISDAYEGDALAAMINNIESTNPKSIAEAVLMDATKKGIRDDSTVVVARFVSK
ncbi:MAG: SpoIIE family protein phosphatase [Firmicutes bacterium]|nr:SpoIIE family protein phosphatase [Bacillota bacterium]